MKGISHIAFKIAFFLFAGIVTGQVHSEPLAGEITRPVEGLIGSQYYINEWLNGDVTLINGAVARDKKLRYNGLLDEVFWLHEESLQHIKLDRHLISEFCLTLPDSGDSLLFRRIETDALRLSRTGDIFVQVLYDDVISLYAYRRIARRGDVVEKRGRARIMLTEIEPAHIYFFILPDKKVVTLENISRRSVYRAFREKRNELGRYLRIKNMDTADDEFLIETAKILKEIFSGRD